MKNDDIQDLTTVAKDKAHSDADFMAEIDEQMTEIKSGPKKTSSTRKTSNPPSRKATEDLAPEEVNKEQVEPEAQPTTYNLQSTTASLEQAEKAETGEQVTGNEEQAEDEVRAQKLEVSEENTEVNGQSSVDGDKGEIIQVKKIPKPIVITPEPEKVVMKAEIPDGASGKALQPIDMGQGEQETQIEQEEQPEEVEPGIQVVEKEEDTVVPVMVKRDNKDMTSESNDANWLDSVPVPEESGKVEQVDQGTKKEEGDSRQTLKTFDATKYHLPMKDGQHTKQNSVSPLVAVVLLSLLVLIIVIAAIDMGVIDVGVDLPFDIL